MAVVMLFMVPESILPCCACNGCMHVCLPALILLMLWYMMDLRSTGYSSIINQVNDMIQNLRCILWVLTANFQNTVTAEDILQYPRRRVLS